MKVYIVVAHDTESSWIIAACSTNSIALDYVAKSDNFEDALEIQEWAIDEQA